MIRQLFTFILLLSLFTVSAQPYDSTYKNQIKFSFFRLVDYVSPGIEITYEKLHSKRWATELSAAYLGLYSKSYPKGYRLGVERKYFIKTRRSFNNYISSEGVFVNTALNDRTSFFDSAINNTITDPFQIHKKTGTLNFKTGSQIISGRIIFEFAFGLGIRYRIIKHKERSVPYNPPLNGGFNSYVEKSEGSWWLITVPFNVKFGYAF